MNSEETVLSQAAEEVEETNGSAPLTHFLMVHLNEEHYFIALSLITRIIKPLKIFQLPHTLDFIAGVSNFSGEVVPVVDLKKVLKLPDLGQVGEQRFFICKYRDIKVALIVDKVIDSREIDASIIKTDTTRVLENEFISGEYIHRQTIIGVLDVVKFIDTHKAA